MQVTTSLVLILAIFVASVHTQPPPSPTPGVTPSPGPTPTRGPTPSPGPAVCTNIPRSPNCRGLADAGTGGPGCIAGPRFAYNRRTQTCTLFQYRGCRGNSNRYCTEAVCRSTCRRRR